MLKHLIIFALISIALISCGSKVAADFNNAVIEKEKSLEPDVRSTETKVAAFIREGKYDSVTIAGEAMEKILQQRIDEIDALPLPDAKGADDFKTAALAYFRHMKSIYTIYKDIGNAESEEKRTEVMGELQTLVNKNTTVVTAFQAAQRKYADANGFKLK